MLQDINNVDTKELFLAEALNPYGTMIFITDDGKIETMEAGSWYKGENRLFFGKASGEWSDDDWGIRQHSDDETGELWYTVETLDGRWESASDAFEAAVEAFGITAEQHDELQEMLEIRVTAENEAEAQCAAARKERGE